MIKYFFMFVLLFLTACTGKDNSSNLIYSHGAVMRTDTTEKRIHLVFTGDEFAQGGDVLRKTLGKHGVKGSFFFTGNFYRNPDFEPIIRGLHEDGHYLGAHSDRHLLYATWENRDSLLVTHEEFLKDLKDNYTEMERFGIKKEDAPYYIPPYEWYNKEIARWTEEAGFILVNFSPGTYSNADWTTPDLGRRYVSSDTIFARILRYEEDNGLNGFILLTHIGAHPDRPDPFHFWMDDLISELKERGYRFTLLNKAIPY